MITTITDERRVDYSHINIILTKDDVANLIRYGKICSPFDARITVELSTLEIDTKEKNNAI